jgi:sulfocyanin
MSTNTRHRQRRLAAATAAAALIAAGPARAQSGTARTDTIAPDWIAYDAAATSVDLKITAALTSVNGGWNFNGYANGDLTIAVPLGWTVKVTFVSRDANVPHSLGIIAARPDSLPPSGDQALRLVAFRGAYTYPFTAGSGAFQEQSFAFRADKTGTFLLYCGVPGHAASGMWDYFVVAEGLDRPVVTVRRKEPAPKDARTPYGLQVDGHRWSAMGPAERESFVNGFLAGAAAAQAVETAGGARSSLERQTAELGSAGLAQRLQFPFAPHVYLARLQDYYFYHDRRDRPVAVALLEINHTILTRKD